MPLLRLQLPRTRHHPEAEYIDALLQTCARPGPAAGRTLSTLFIGGGTPSLFSAHAIEQTAAAGARSHYRWLTTLKPPWKPTPAARRQENSWVSGKPVSTACRWAYRVSTITPAGPGPGAQQRPGPRRYRAWRRPRTSTAFNIDLMHGLPGQSVTDSGRGSATRHWPTTLATCPGIS